MKSIMFETLMDDNFSVYLLRDMEEDTTGDYVKNLIEKLKNIPVSFATIDLGYITLREFNETHLAKVLKEYEIPFFSVELPHYVKGHFSSQISEMKNKYNELKSSYELLKDKNSPGAQLICSQTINICSTDNLPAFSRSGRKKSFKPECFENRY